MAGNADSKGDLPHRSAGDLWLQAHAEYPYDRERLRVRYRELMLEHGHLVSAEPGADHNLPCGWPGNSANTDA